jgi:hypothetical protein
MRIDGWQQQISSVHKSTKHSPRFLLQQEIFLQLTAVQFLACLSQENTNLASCLSHDVLWSAKEFPYKNPSEINLSNKCTNIKLGTVAQICMETYQLWLFSQQRISSMTYEVLHSLRDRNLSFESSWFTHFEGNDYFQNICNRLIDYMVLHHRNSKSNLQIYIA